MLHLRDVEAAFLLRLFRVATTGRERAQRDVSPPPSLLLLLSSASLSRWIGFHLSLCFIINEHIILLKSTLSSLIYDDYIFQNVLLNHTP